MTARDLFEESSAGQVPASARTGDDAEAVNGDRPVDGAEAHCDERRLAAPAPAAGFEPSRARVGEPGSIEWFAAKQAEYRAAGEASARAHAQAHRDAQEGIDQAVAAADREVEGWSDLALRYVRLYATQNRGRQFIGNEIVQASVAAGIIQPTNSKAWGGPIQRAARAGIIRKVGTAPDPNRHTNPVPLWEAA